MWTSDLSTWPTLHWGRGGKERREGREGERRGEKAGKGRGGDSRGESGGRRGRIRRTERVEKEGKGLEVGGGGEMGWT